MFAYFLQAKISPINFDYIGYFFLRYNEYKRQKENCFSLARSHLAGLGANWPALSQIISRTYDLTFKNSNFLVRYSCIIFFCSFQLKEISKAYMDKKHLGHSWILCILIVSNFFVSDLFVLFFPYSTCSIWFRVIQRKLFTYIFAKKNKCFNHSEILRFVSTHLFRASVIILRWYL